jgi:hypothetical protein
MPPCRPYHLLGARCGGSLLGTTPALDMHATTLAQYVAAGGWTAQPTELGMPVHAF